MKDVAELLHTQLKQSGMLMPEDYDTFIKEFIEDDKEGGIAYHNQLIAGLNLINEHCGTEYDTTENGTYTRSVVNAQRHFNMRVALLLI